MKYSMQCQIDGKTFCMC